MTSEEMWEALVDDALASKIGRRLVETFDIATIEGGLHMSNIGPKSKAGVARLTFEIIHEIVEEHVLI
jgi:hypothetical protein